MDRLTRKKDKYECRISGGCPAEEWIEEMVNFSFYHEDVYVCKNCPFMEYINKLAEYEDAAEEKLC